VNVSLTFFEVILHGCAYNVHADRSSPAPSMDVCVILRRDVPFNQLVPISCHFRDCKLAY